MILILIPDMEGEIHVQIGNFEDLWKSIQQEPVKRGLSQEWHCDLPSFDRRGPAL